MGKSQINRWQTEAKNYKLKYDRTKQLYQTALKNNLEKDLKISRLENALMQGLPGVLPLAHPSALTQESFPNNSPAAQGISVLHVNIETEQSTQVQPSTNEAYKYDTFQNSFEEIELAKLRTIDGESKNDATFVRLVLKYLYKDNIAILSQRSVKGTSPRKKRRKLDGEEFEFGATQPMTPVKLKTLAGMFTERLSTSNGKESEKMLRQKKTEPTDCKGHMLLA